MLLKSLLITAISFFFSLQALSQFGNPFERGCEPDHAFSCPGRVHIPVKVDKCDVRVGSKKYTLNEKAPLEVLLQFMQTVPKGQEVLARFIKQYRKGEITVQQLTKEIREEKKMPDNALAAFFYDLPVKEDKERGIKAQKAKKAIYVDLEEEMGLLTVFLFHEIYHAIDEAQLGLYDMWQASHDELEKRKLLLDQMIEARVGRPGEEIDDNELTPMELQAVKDITRHSAEMKHKMIFWIEKPAYMNGDVFMNQMIKEHGCYKKYVNQHDQNGHDLIWNSGYNQKVLARRRFLNKKYIRF